MHSSFVTAPDGARIAYDFTGAGSPLLLLHGGGRTRRDWHDAGYVARLQATHTVITLDLRGHGESEHPCEISAYTTDKMCQDVLAVADACHLEHFALWGFSYGGNVARYLAVQSERVTKLIVIGIPFGLGADGEFRQSIEQFREHWEPILHAQRNGTLDTSTLTQEDQATLDSTNMAVTLAWLSALLDWRAIEPSDLRCSTLWLVGSENTATIQSVHHYQPMLARSLVQVQIVDGLNHGQEFAEIDRVLPIMQAFTQDR